MRQMRPCFAAADISFFRVLRRNTKQLSIYLRIIVYNRLLGLSFVF